MNREQRRCKHPPKKQQVISENALTKTKWIRCTECKATYPSGGWGELIKKATDGLDSERAAADLGNASRNGG